MLISQTDKHFEGLQRIEQDSSFEELFKRIGKSWTNIICFFTFEIYCFGCEIECLDEEITKSFLKGLQSRAVSNFKAKCISLLKATLNNGFQPERIEPSKTPKPKHFFDSEFTFKQTGLNFLHNNDISYTLATVIYVLWGIPYTRYVRTL